MADSYLGVLPLNGKSIVTEFGDLGGSLGLTDEYWFDLSVNSDLNIETSVGTEYFYGSVAYFTLFRDSDLDGIIDFEDYESSDYIDIFSSPDEGEKYGFEYEEYTNLEAGRYALEVFFSDYVYDDEIFVYQLDISAEPNFPTAISTKSEVHRFFNSSIGAHFYTADENEKNYIHNNLNHYEYEGTSYITADRFTGNSPEEVYRFFNSTTGVHLYTTNEDERDYIIDRLPNFTYEGEKFYAYETQQSDTVPIYRFYEPTVGVHFYTSNEGEMSFIKENLGNYIYEGIAYYAFNTSDI